MLQRLCTSASGTVAFVSSAQGKTKTASVVAVVESEAFVSTVVSAAVDGKELDVGGLELQNCLGFRQCR